MGEALGVDILEGLDNLSDRRDDHLEPGAPQRAQIATVCQLEGHAGQGSVREHRQGTDDAGMCEPGLPFRIGLEANHQCGRCRLVGRHHNTQRHVRAARPVAGRPDLGTAPATQEVLEVKTTGQFPARCELCHGAWQCARIVTVGPTRDPWRE